MRIAMVSEHASPLAAIGGAEAGGQNVHVRELSTALAKAGHEVTVWTRRDHPGLPDTVRMRPGVRVRHVQAGPAEPISKDDLVPYLPEFARALRAAWAKDRPEVVHAHFWMSGMVSMAAAGGRMPVLPTFHALGNVELRHHGRHDPSPDGRIQAERVVAKAADRVLATSTDELFELTRLGAPRRRISVVPAGVDTEEFAPTGERAQRDEERPRLVTLGRLVRRKGVDETIQALRLVPDAELVVAGGEPDPARDPDACRLRARADQAGVADRVRLIGPVPREEVPALLRSADAVVCTPWYEPFGMVPLEAMACGRPVVASAVGGIQDTVIDKVTGRLVPPRQPEALAHALREVISAPTVAETYGIAGRDRALARYTWQRVAATTEKAYRSAIDAHAVGAEHRAAATARR